MPSFPDNLSLSMKDNAFKSLLSVIVPSHLRVVFSLILGRDTLSRKLGMHSSDFDRFSLKRVW